MDPQANSEHKKSWTTQLKSRITDLLTFNNWQLWLINFGDESSKDIRAERFRGSVQQPVCGSHTLPTGGSHGRGNPGIGLHLQTAHLKGTYRYTKISIHDFFKIVHFLHFVSAPTSHSNEETVVPAHKEDSNG